MQYRDFEKSAVKPGFTLSYYRSPKAIPPPRLRYLLTTTPSIGVFVILSYYVLAAIKTCTSRPLIPTHHVPTTSEVRC